MMLIDGCDCFLSLIGASNSSIGMVPTYYVLWLGLCGCVHRGVRAVC
jgi:hypothetical protein